MDSREPVRILYIAGFERSGSTILQNVLAQLPGFAAVGEIRYLWKALSSDRTQCGCGNSVRDCDFWRRVLARAYPNQAVPLNEIKSEQEDKKRDLVPMLLGTDNVLQQRKPAYLECLRRIYRAVHAETNCRVVIDTSKSPLYSYSLRLVPGIDPVVVHIVRDPRGVASSLVKRRREGHPNYRRYNVFSGTMNWAIWNLTIEWLWRRFPSRMIRVCYEDFVREPEPVLRRISDFTGSHMERIPISDDNVVLLTPSHTVGGSPSRFQVGEIRLANDDGWKVSLTPGQIASITTLSAPLLYRYKYSVTR
jgi:hypothetical protein